MDPAPCPARSPSRLPSSLRCVRPTRRQHRCAQPNSGGLLWLAIEQSRLPLKLFDSSAGFLLADGSVRSPDASVVRLERWQALSEAERDGFPPLCTDLVVELAVYMAN